MIIHIFANKTNIGDWLSARGIQKLLNRSDIKECFCDEHFISETLNELSKATENDFVVIGGGGLFMDYFSPFWEGFLESVGNTPFCIWGVGFCHLKQKNSLASFSLLNEVVKRSKFTVFRDEFSRNYLSEGACSAVIPCPSIAFFEPQTKQGIGLLHINHSGIVGADVSEKIDFYGEAYAHSSDRPFEKTKNRIPSGNEKELNRILSLYQRSDVVISSALHGCIISVAMGKKIIAVSGDHKIDAFMASAGLTEWVLNYDQVDNLPHLLNKISTQKSTKEFVSSVTNENRMVAAKINNFLSTI